ncbi:hypothetical protein EP7_001014 [Isosphaeraceae bacterium EP7]
MLKRLIWKEWRTIGPLWATVLLAVCVLECFMLYLGNEQIRHGGLYWLAILSSVIYACTAAAAAFAAEREVQTLSLLDAMGVDRPHLWTGKLLFSVASTIVLAQALLGFAALGSHPDTLDKLSWGLVGGVAFMLVEAICWGLFWSALCSTALRAALGTIVSLSATLTIQGKITALDQQFLNNSLDLFHGTTFFIRVGISLLTLGLSWYLMNRRATDKLTMFSSDESIGGARLASYPMEKSSRWKATARSIRWQSWQEGRRTLLGLVVLAFCVPLLHFYVDWRTNDLWIVLLLPWMIASLSTGIATFEPENRGRTYRFLAHHGVRPWWIWFNKLRFWLLPLTAFGAFLLLYGFLFSGWIWGSPPAGKALPILLQIIQSQPIWFPLMVLLYLLSPVLVGLITFSIGQLLAMVIPRGITAWLCALLLLIPFVAFPIALIVGRLMSGWMLPLIPLVFFGASLAWSRDWVEGRRGIRSWSKLAALVLVPTVSLCVIYTIDRATGVPDIGPLPTTAALVSTNLPPEANAAEVYRAAYLALIADSGANLPGGMNSMMGMAAPEDESVVETKAENEAQPPDAEGIRRHSNVLGLIREAAAMPLSQFGKVSPRIFEGNPDRIPMQQLQALIENEFKTHLERKDLGAAWNDVMTLFRMANHLGQTTPQFYQTLEAAEIHAVACQAALDWTLAPDQTEERLQGKLKELESLPAPPSAVIALESQAASQDLFLGLPKEEFKDLLVSSGYFGDLKNRGSFESTIQLPALSFPWERERARRAMRLQNTAYVAVAAVEPYRRNSHSAWENQNWLGGPIPPPTMPGQPDWKTLQWALMSTPLLQYLRINESWIIDRCDLELNRRRMLTMAMAIQAWRLGHDGTMPSSLDLLVPGCLPDLSIDPFSGEPYRVFLSNGTLGPLDRIPESDKSNPGQAMPPLLPSQYPPPGRFFEQRYPDARKLLQPLKPGYPLIIGFGPDRQWNQGTMNASAGQPEDLILVLPRVIRTQPSTPDEAANP